MTKQPTKKELANEAIKAINPLEYMQLTYNAYNYKPSNHYNPYTKIYFSGLNLWELEISMLINNFNSCNWSTFCQYKDNNKIILKGSKSTRCTLAIKKYKKDDNGDKIDNGVYFKDYNLFNQDQVKEV